MPENDPDSNPPPDGYAEGLYSYLFQQYRKKWIEIIKTSKNSTTNNIWFSHVSTWFIHPQLSLSNAQFPAVFVLTPSAIFEKHGKLQYTAKVNLQIEYYCKHYVRNITNELEHFSERILYLIQSNPNIGFTELYGTVLCQTMIEPTAVEFDYEVSQNHIIRSAVVTATSSIPLIVVEPP